MLRRKHEKQQQQAQFIKLQQAQPQHLRFSRSVSLLNRLNQKAISAMKLHIPSLMMQQQPTTTANTLSQSISSTSAANQRGAHQKRIDLSNVINENEDDNLTFLTPNASLRDDGNNTVEEFRTPLNEMPPLTPNTILSMTTINNDLNSQDTFNNSVVQTPTSIYRSVNSVNRSCSRNSEQLDEQTNDSNNTRVYDSEEEDADGCARRKHLTNDVTDEDAEDTENDSGLDENYHTPRLSNIKSMENLSLLEMEYHKASQELDRNSPRRLKALAESEQTPLTKIKSLNNLLIDQNQTVLMADNTKTEFPFLKPYAVDEAQTDEQGKRKNSIISNNSTNKLFTKNPKVGNTKFIGNENHTPQLRLPLTKIGNRSVQTASTNQYPMHKIRSVGTLPDVVAERVPLHPFLTPTSERKPSLTLFMDTNRKRDNSLSPPLPLLSPSGQDLPPSSKSSYAFNMDAAKHNFSKETIALLLHHMNSSAKDSINCPASQRFFPMQENKCQDSRIRAETGGSVPLSYSPFERAYHRSLMKSSTLLRQNQNMAHLLPLEQTRSNQPQQESCNALSHSSQLKVDNRDLRPQSICAVYDLMRFVIDLTKILYYNSYKLSLSFLVNILFLISLYLFLHHFSAVLVFLFVYQLH